MKTQEFSQRLKELAESLSPGNDAAFARLIGLTPQTFHSYAKGRGSVPGGVLLKMIAEKTKCSGDWLLTGKGDMFPPKVTRSDNGNLFLPVVACASAASKDGVCMLSEDAGHYSARLPIPPDARMIQVHGDSMFPVAEDGQHVIITEDKPQSGDLAVIETTDGEIIFKRIQIVDRKVLCESVNKHRDYMTIIKPLSAVRKMWKVWGVKF